MTTTDRLKLWVESILRVYDDKSLTRGEITAMLVLAIVQAARAKVTVKWMAATAGTSNMTAINARRRSIELGFLTEDGDFPDDPEEAADPIAAAAVRHGTVRQLAWKLQNPPSPR